jgi:glutathione S-transferase
MRHPLTLHYHPLSSCCHKVLIALDELGLDVEKRLLNLSDPQERAAFVALWPTGKMPVLVDRGKVVPETSIIIEHLQQHYGAPERSLLPADPERALEVRLWDRLLDLYVMTPMQALTADLLRPESERDPTNVAEARARLLSSYAMIDGQLDGRPWIAGDDFSLADCAAAPALFYAFAYLPWPLELTRLGQYFERLVARPSVARTIDQARPFFEWFPGRAGLQPRFYEPSTG